jgi:dihydroorotase
MEIKQKFKLIDGKFSQTEAMEVLNNVFSSKIQFHQMKIFSSQIRFGIDDETSLDRINQLKKSIETVSKTIKDARIGNGKIEITAVINVSFSNFEKSKEEIGDFKEKHDKNSDNN